MKVQNRTSFSKKYDIDLILSLKKYTTYFPFLKNLNMSVTFFLKKLSGKWKHLELNQYTLKLH